MLMVFKLVGPKELKTTGSLFLTETVLITLEELEDVVDDDCLQIDLFLVI